MSNRITIFGLIEFIDDDVENVNKAMSELDDNYLKTCFDPSRVISRGYNNKHLSLSFSLNLNTYEEEQMIIDFEKNLRQIPFLSCRMFVENERSGYDRFITYLKDIPRSGIMKFVQNIPDQEEMEYL